MDFIISIASTVFAQAKLLNLKQITTFNRWHDLKCKLYLHKQSY